jgi:hypothetical protein
VHAAEAPPRLEGGGLLGLLGSDSAADLVAQLRSHSSPSMTPLLARCGACLSSARWGPCSLVSRLLVGKAAAGSAAQVAA